MNETESQDGALSVLTVLDLSEGVAGPYAAALFASYGAQVIKVENPGSGDRARGWAAGNHSEELSFEALNAGKLSLTLDYEKPSGADALRRLAEDADAIIEDLPSRRRAELGLDDETLLAHVPRLVIAQVSRTAAAPASPEGGAHELTAGLHVFAATLAALWRAAQTEHGQTLRVPVEAVLASTPSPVQLPAALAPFGMSETPALGPQTAPNLGEHTDYVLHDLIGWEAAAIEALRAEGAA